MNIWFHIFLIQIHITFTVKQASPSNSLKLNDYLKLKKPTFGAYLYFTPVRAPLLAPLALTISIGVTLSFVIPS